MTSSWSDGLDDVGAGDEHVAGLFGHEGEVGDGGGVDGSAGAGAEDGGDLRDDSAGEGVAEEDVGVAGEGDDAFLDAGAAGVVEADDGGADAEGGVHDLDDLGGVGLGEGAAEDGEVLGEDEDDAAVDAAVAGDEAVAGDSLVGHAEVGGSVGYEFVGLFEGALVEEEVDALAGGELAGFVTRGRGARGLRLLRRWRGGRPARLVCAGGAWALLRGERDVRRRP